MLAWASFFAAGALALSSLEGISNAPTPIQKEWSRNVELLEAQIGDAYYTEPRWRKDFECAACRVVMSELGSVVESLEAWQKTPTEDQYLERFLFC